MRRLSIIDPPGPDEVGETPETFLDALGGPTIFTWPGRDRTRRRAVATLLHGNEPSGLRALHAWLRSGLQPAVDVVCFLGAVEAARLPPGLAHRALPGGRDLNRCFRPPHVGDEGAIAAQALAALRNARPEALVDLHNNTGHNPPYGVGTRVDSLRLGLTALFATRFIHNTIPLGALSEVGVDDLNAVAIECGRAGDPAADAVARSGLARFLTSERLPSAPPPEPPLMVFGDPIRVAVRPETRIVFGDRPRPEFDLTIRHDIDRHNFQPLLPGVPVGWIGRGTAWPLIATGADGEDVSRDYFIVRHGLLETRRHTVPIMMTTDAAAVRMDCLFYIVHAR